MQVHYTELLRQTTLDQTISSSKINEDDSFSDSLSDSSSSSSSSSMYCSEEDEEEEKENIEDLESERIATIDEANSDIKVSSKDLHKDERFSPQEIKNSSLDDVRLEVNTIKEDEKEELKNEIQRDQKDIEMTTDHTVSATERYEQFLSSVMQEEEEIESSSTTTTTATDNKSSISLIPTTTSLQNFKHQENGEISDLKESTTARDGNKSSLIVIPGGSTELTTTKSQDNKKSPSKMPSVAENSKDHESHEKSNPPECKDDKSISSNIPPTVAEDFTIDLSTVKAFDIRDRKVCRISISSRHKIFQMRRTNTDHQQQQPRSLSFHESRPYGQIASIGKRSHSDENFITIGNSSDINLDGNQRNVRKDSKTSSDSELSLIHI